MSFWLVAAAIALTAAVLLCWPLLRRGGPWLGLGLALLLLFPVSTLLLYQSVGAPEGIRVSGVPGPDPVTDASVDQLLAQLQDRLATEPDNVEGWMLLGRSLKSLQRHDEALGALRKAQSLAPNDPIVKVELAEAMIFTTAPGEVSREARTLLDAALDAQPDLQKALWLRGMLSFQAGDDDDALADWERLLPLLEPGSAVATSVEQQMDRAKARQGGETIASPAPAPAQTGDWPGVTATVTAPPSLGAIPVDAALFLIARDPAAPAPPLGVVRVPAPEFPIEIRLDDGNSMMAGRPVSGVSEIELLARLSLSGRPTAAPGDPESPAIRVSTGNAGTGVELPLVVPAD